MNNDCQNESVLSVITVTGAEEITMAMRCERFRSAARALPISGEGRAPHYPELARDVVSRDADMIFAISNNIVLDFKAATTAIPIVGLFAVPVEAGIVASLARTGGNITGVSVDVGLEQWDKRVQLLQQVVPQAARLGVLQSRAAREQWGAFKANVTNGWETRRLARRSIIRQTRLSIAVYLPP